MTLFALTPLEGGSEIALTDGKVTVGRGPFLRIVDKRVSRHHAIIEVSGSTITVLPIHTNPTFYKASDATKFEPLEKDQPKELNNGDFIAFLPNDVVFQVLRKDMGIQSEMKGETEEEVKSETKEELKGEKKEELKHGTKEELKSETHEELEKGNIEEKNENDIPVIECDEKEETEVVLPLNKTRILPSWMTNKQDKTPSKKAKKSSPTETKSRKSKTTAENTESVATEEKIEEKYDKESLEDTDTDVMATKDEEEDDVTEEEFERNSPSPVPEVEPKKRKRKAFSDSDENESPVESEKTLPPCPYGSNCYRKNPVHFQEYSHDEPSHKSESENSEEELPECPYGLECYRRNRQHQKEYRHTATPKTLERRAKKAKTNFAEDDIDLPNDYDSGDSFLNEESESSCQPSEADDDSDWRPDDEESGDEDVGQLLTEAKRFAKNKKMRKPT